MATRVIKLNTKPNEVPFKAATAPTAALEMAAMVVVAKAAITMTAEDITSDIFHAERMPQTLCRSDQVNVTLCECINMCAANLCFGSNGTKVAAHSCMPYKGIEKPAPRELTKNQTSRMKICKTRVSAKTQ